MSRMRKMVVSSKFRVVTECSKTSPHPLTARAFDFFDLIDEHLRARHGVHDLTVALNDRAHQFRVIQKRLLVRYRDRNAAPLAHMDSLLEGTYNQVMACASEMEQALGAVKGAAVRLSCATRLLLLLMRHRYDLDEANYGALAAHLSPLVNDNVDQGWEEATDAAITHLLRTVLSKKGGGGSAATHTPGSTLAMPTDSTKLKKHISIVCDRLSKGARLVGGRVADGDRRRQRKREKKKKKDQEEKD